MSRLEDEISISEVPVEVVLLEENAVTKLHQNE
jgi:hypothetical protein